MVYALNFRQLAGHSELFGQPIRARTLYRCGELMDQEAVLGSTPVDLPFGLIVDLRYAAERARNPSPWPADLEARLLFPADSGEREQAPHMLLPDNMHEPAAMLAFFCNLYRELPFEATYRESFPRALRALADHPPPMLIHCTGGKDRTGILIALVQHILGVCTADITAEYMRTNESADLAALAPQLAERLNSSGSHGVTIELASRILRVDPRYLAAALD
jgi:protein-tyrosine phosphatase